MSKKSFGVHEVIHTSGEPATFSSFQENELPEDYVSLRSALALANEKLKMQEESIQKLEGDLNAQDETIISLQRTIYDKNEEMEKEREKSYEDYKQSRAAEEIHIQSLTRQLDETKRQLQQARTSTPQKTNEGSGEELENARRQKTSLEQQNASLQATIKTLKTENADLKDLLKSMTEARKTIEVAYTAVNDDFDRLNYQMAQLTQNNLDDSELRQELEKLRNEYNSLKDSPPPRTTQQSTTVHTTTVTQDPALLKELSLLRSDNLALKQENGNLTRELARLKGDLAVQNGSNGSVEQELRNTVSAKNQLELECDTLRSKNASLASQIAILKSGPSSGAGASDHLHDLEDMIESLQKQLREANTSLRKAQEENKVLRERLTSVQLNDRQLLDEIAQLQNQLGGLGADSYYASDLRQISRELDDKRSQEELEINRIMGLLKGRPQQQPRAEPQFAAVPPEPQYVFSQPVHSLSSSPRRTSRREEYPAQPYDDDSFLRQGVIGNTTYFPESGIDVTFPVLVWESPASRSMGVYGHTWLNISARGLTLLDSINNTPLWNWTLQEIKRYGKDQGVFSFEAGPSSRAPGVFYLATANMNDVFQAVDSVALAGVGY